MKKWVILNKSKVNPSENLRTRSQKSKFDEEIIKILLENRGLKTKKEIEEFLNPNLNHVLNDDLGIDKNEIKKAIARIKKAIRDKESITVYTDYDVDGITSGAILWETLYTLGAKVLPYVPHRIDEGYGLSRKGIDKVKKEQKTTLIITVDHGIACNKEVEYALNKGIDVIIIDHHLKPLLLPKSAATVHTTQMCAAAVVWIFCHYLLGVTSKKTLEDKLDLVALATIADLVPLTGPNRVLTYLGLEKLNKTNRIGLKTLFNDAGLKSGSIGVYEVGHIISPRINAMGRLGHAIDSLRLICTNKEEKAVELSRLLSLTNRERQLLTQNSTDHAFETLKSLGMKKIIIISHKSYSQGIIGLIAGKLMEEYYRPAIVISVGDEYSKASARSIKGFNIVTAIKKLSHLTSDAGGHPLAAGFTIPTKNIDDFKIKMQELVEKELSDDLLVRELRIDAEIDLEDVTENLLNKIEILAPVGMGNPEPVFASFGVDVAGARVMGKDNNHLKLALQVKSPNKFISAVGFGMGNLYYKIAENRKIDIAFTINRNEWNGKSDLQLKLKDVRLS